LVLWGVKDKNVPVIFQSAAKNKRKIKDKWEFVRKICFRKNVLVFSASLKQMTLGT